MVKSSPNRRQAERAALLLDHAIALGGGHDPALLTLRIKVAQMLEDEDDVRRFAGMLAQVRPPAMAVR